MLAVKNKKKKRKTKTGSLLKKSILSFVIRFYCAAVCCFQLILFEFFAYWQKLFITIFLCYVKKKKKKKKHKGIRNKCKNNIKQLWARRKNS